ncbi:MAG: hypothetical protein AAF688_03365 [Bacteroidota bacterium]
MNFSKDKLIVVLICLAVSTLMYFVWPRVSGQEFGFFQWVSILMIGMFLGYKSKKEIAYEKIMEEKEDEA